MDLSCDENLKMKFTKLELDKLWIKIKNEYLSMSRKTLLFLTMF